MGGKGILAIEAGKNPEGMNALAGSTCNRQIAFMQAKHLSTLNDARVSCSTSGPDCVVRTSHTHVQGNFPRWIVRHGAGVVMVRPATCVVVETLDHVNFVFGFDVSVLGDSNVDKPGSIGVFQSTPGVDRLVGGVNPDAACSCAPPDLFLFW